MKTDILTRADIEGLINQFYSLVMKDEEIAPFFSEVAKVDWEHHLPQMYNFWESVLFSKKIFQGNPLRKHLELNQKQRMTHRHFAVWMRIFLLTVDNLFIGENADKIKQFAQMIRNNLESKVVLA